MPPKEIHEDFMKTLGKESPSFSTVKRWAAEFKMGRECIEDDGRIMYFINIRIKTFIYPWHINRHRERTEYNL